MIDFDDLKKEGLLQEEEYASISWGDNLARVDYSLLYSHKFSILRIACSRISGVLSERFQTFCKEQNVWLNDYALYMSIKDYYDGQSWQEWPETLQKREKDSLEAIRQELTDEILFWKKVQFLFFYQWDKLKAYAEENNIIQEMQKPEQEEEAILPGFENEEEETILPGFEDTTEEKVEMPAFEEDEEETVLPGFKNSEEENEEEEEEATLPGFEDNTKMEEQYTNVLNNLRNSNEQENNSNMPIELNEKEEEQYPELDINSIIKPNQKLVAFLGTSKNGTSFLVNNVAEILVANGINTAILDLTHNRNAYYIYTKNEDDLREQSNYIMNNLKAGRANGIQESKNLTVYTALPDDDVPMEQYEEILSTLVKNHSLILIDCDFETDFGYFAASQEIYLVQSMDIITIQPLTAFLRDLQSKNIYQPENLRIVINKELPVKTLTVKNIIGGLSFYNDPSMSFMRELFNRETAKYCTIPFEIATYSKYLEGLVNCKISLNGYSKEFMQALRTLENMVYPLMEPTPASNRGAKSNNNYERTRFSNEMNDTLNQMKKNF